MLATLLMLLGCAAITTAEDRATIDQAPTEKTEEGFTPLFDGRSLAGWEGAVDSYHAKDGLLSAKPGAAGALLTSGEYADFELRFEFRLTPGANNGVALRAPRGGDAAYAGMESQVLDNTAKKYANLEEYQYHGSIYGVAPAKRGSLRPVGEWNEESIVCRGRQVTVRLNGKVIVDVNLDKAAPDGKTIDGHDHPGLKRAKGRLGFLGHGDPVDFRNIRVREFAPVAGG